MKPVDKKYRYEELKSITDVFSKTIDINKASSDFLQEMILNSNEQEFKEFVLSLYLHAIKQPGVAYGGRAWCRLIDKVIALHFQGFDKLGKEKQKTQSIINFLNGDKNEN